MGYTIGMSKSSFSLDIPEAGLAILQNMSMAVVKQSANAMAVRARSMSSSLSSDPPSISVSTSVGTIKRGVRAIATVSAEGKNARQNYIGFMALKKAIDAGRVK